MTEVSSSSDLGGFKKNFGPAADTHDKLTVRWKCYLDADSIYIEHFSRK